MRELNEIACVGAGIGGGYASMHELHVMKCNEAMAGPKANKWKLAVEEEYDRMMSHGVFEPVPNDEVPDDAKILTLTWALKKKASRKYRA